MVVGIKSWLLQRITAVILLAYTGILTWFFVCNTAVTYSKWFMFFTNPFIKIATIITLTSLLLHAWLGLWTITTDYLNKYLIIRLFVQTGFIVFLSICLVWGTIILYGF